MVNLWGLLISSISPTFLYLCSSGAVRMGHWHLNTKKSLQRSRQTSQRQLQHKRRCVRAEHWKNRRSNIQNVRSKLACSRAEDKKIVALILEAHKPNHMLAHAQCNRKPNGCIAAKLFIQMVWNRGTKLKVFFIKSHFMESEGTGWVGIVLEVFFSLEQITNLP